jgi:hypothetical protein
MLRPVKGSDVPWLDLSRQALEMGPMQFLKNLFFEYKRVLCPLFLLP